MAKLSDADLTAALLIAVALIVIAIIALPGPVRAHPHMITGYWHSQITGAMYKVHPGFGRVFTVLTENGLAAGTMHGMRGVRVVFPGDNRVHRGYIRLGSRKIAWKNGDTWSRQGI
jgi:hypothetical protein